MSVVSGTRWLQADGNPVSCREKLKVLDENQSELEQVLRDAFEDAVLMGVDPERMRAVLLDTVRDLRSPHRPDGER
ncbi:MAG: hypothetical protein INR65_08110 [Gluconacetobacter diazotrophicus]|nr:hypothetical protein [Gluconacetobacter diazotrophicus]